MTEDASYRTETVRTVSRILRRYLVAVWTVGIILGITLLVSPFISPDISSLFLIAVMVSAWRGGLGAGLLATFLSMVIDVLLFLPPTASLSLDNNDFVQLLVNVFAALVVGTLSASRRKAEDERQKLLMLERSARIEAEEANEVKDEFLAAVSHELRTPLTTIKTLTRLLAVKNRPKKEQRGYLEDIASECDRQIDLVQNLLDISRIKAGGVKIEFERVNVEEVLNDCEKIERVEAAERGHEITVEVSRDLLSVRADREALRRVVCTVAENAVKYTQDGGKIKLKAYADTASPENVVIEVSDNGRGISENDLPHIFESFYRGRNGTDKVSCDERPAPGVGLGLYIARSLVKAMKGDIWVETNLGEGSNFSISLPAWQVPSESNLTSYGKTMGSHRQSENL